MTDAINAGKKVTFQYYEYNQLKNKELRHHGSWYLISPYSLLWNNNHYYMISWSEEKEHITTFRVDRIVKLSIDEDVAVPAPGEYRIEKYAKQVFGMYDGEEVEVVLECENKLMKSVVDKFGEDVWTWPVSDSTFQMRAMVYASQTFFGWIVCCII